MFAKGKELASKRARDETFNLLLYRALFLLGIVGSVSSGIAIHMEHKLADPFGLRLLFTIIITGIFVSSFMSGFVKRNLYYFLMVMCFFTGFWLLYDNYLNAFNKDSAYGNMFFIFLSGALFRKRSHLLVYFALLIPSFLTVAFLSGKIDIDLTIYTTAFTMLGFLSFLIYDSRNRTREELVASEDLFRNVFDKSTDAIVILKADALELLGCNEYAFRMFGHEKSDQEPLQVNEFVNRYRNDFMPAIGRGGSWSGEIEMFTSTGSRMWLDASVIRFMAGEQAFIKARFADITSRKKAELELAESEERFRRLLEGSFEGLVIHRKGIILDANQAFADMLGYTLDEIIGSPIERYGTVGGMGQIREHIRSSYEKSYETKGVKKNGTMIDVEVLGKSLPYKGEIARVAAFRDITQRKLNEERLSTQNRNLLKMNTELQQYTYAISHDLKTPLRAIGTLAGWLSSDYEGLLDYEGRENIRLIQSRVKRMYELIEGILHYSKIDYTAESRSKIDMNAVVKQLVETLSLPDHIAIVMDNPLPAIHVNPRLAEQVLGNLLSNAIKFMDKTRGEIHIGGEPEQDMYRFYVKDNGPGIPVKYFQKIFGMFQTLNSEASPESTGIGLALVKKITEMYGGSIWVESREGEGSIFYFTLPLWKT